MLRLFLLYVLTIAWWSLVLFSSGEGASSGWTSDLLNRLLGLTGESLEVANLIVRKSLHIAYYLVLTLLFIGCLSRFKKQWLAFPLSVATGIFDEVRQATMPSRTGTAWDLLWDGLGIALAALIHLRATGSKYSSTARQP